MPPPRIGALLLSVALGAPPGELAAACSCAVPQPWFLGRVKQGELVVLADVAAQTSPTLIDLDVREVLKGDERRTQLRVAGEAGSGCRSSLAPFKAGTRWLFVLTPLEQAEEWVRSGAQYELAGCQGVWWARVEGERVRGLLSERDLRQRKESARPLAEIRRLAAEVGPDRP